MIWAFASMASDSLYVFVIGSPLQSSLPPRNVLGVSEARRKLTWIERISQRRLEENSRKEISVTEKNRDRIKI